jgi:hypothetical protein
MMDSRRKVRVSRHSAAPNVALPTQFTQSLDPNLFHTLGTFHYLLS